MNKTLIDNAYDLAIKEFKKDSFTFKELWTALVKKVKLDQKEQQQVGHLFTTMLQDHRFIFVGNDEWKIREFLTTEQQNELSNALYDFSKEDNKTAKTKDDDMEGSEFNFDDEDDEYKQHAEASLDDEDEEDDDEGEVEERDSDDEDEDSENEDLEEVEEEENKKYN